MSPRVLILVGALIAVVVIPVPVAGQQSPATNWTPSRTAWGDPDLQGVYTFSTQTPVERPKELAGKAFYTEAELRNWRREPRQHADRVRTVMWIRRRRRAAMMLSGRPARVEG